MKHRAAFAMALAVSPCVAQTTHMMMPEGSKDIYLSLAMAYTPQSEGSARNRTYVAPLLSAQFSNGVFIDMNTVGMHLSRNPQWVYGVQLTPTRSRIRVQGPNGWQTRSKFTPEAGGFLSYQLAHGMHLNSRLMYGGSSDHRGLRLFLGASFAMPVAEHHLVGVEAGATLANRSALQADFAVLPDQHGAGLGPYDAAGGLRDTRTSAYWRLQLSAKYSFRAILRWDRLHGSAAASPRIERADGVTAITALTYQF